MGDAAIMTTCVTETDQIGFGGVSRAAAIADVTGTDRDSTVPRSQPVHDCRFARLTGFGFYRHSRCRGGLPRPGPSAMSADSEHGPYIVGLAVAPDYAASGCGIPVIADSASATSWTLARM